jgi:glycosyltransferase involved in cell wall biosynthesis
MGSSSQGTSDLSPDMTGAGGDAQPLRLCYLVAPGFVGGLERIVHGLALGLAARGHEVHVFAVLVPSPEREPFLAAFDGSTVTVHELRLPPGLRHLPAERRAARALFQSLRPDIVHSHGGRPDVLDSGVARRFGVPTVTTIHGESFMGGRTRLHEWVQWRTYRRFDAVIAVSARLRETALLRGVPPDRAHLIRNAWPGGMRFASREAARQELGLAPAETAVGWLGRMIPVKGGDIFLRALAEPGGARATAVLIGDGSERTQLESLAAQLGLGKRVRFVGGIEGGARLLPAFDAFVLSSRSEGTPIVLLEAMAAGVPIVASRVGGVPDVVGDGEAVLVAPENTAALAEGLRLILEAPATAAAMAERAHRRLEIEFSTAAWLGRHEELYRALIKTALASGASGAS